MSYGPGGDAADLKRMSSGIKSLGNAGLQMKIAQLKAESEGTTEAPSSSRSKDGNTEIIFSATD